MTWAPCVGADKPVTLGFSAKVDFQNVACSLKEGKPKNSENFSELGEGCYAMATWSPALIKDPNIAAGIRTQRIPKYSDELKDT